MRQGLKALLWKIKKRKNKRRNVVDKYD
jgi:hypothetical protein